MAQLDRRDILVLEWVSITIEKVPDRLDFKILFVKPSNKGDLCAKVQVRWPVSRMDGASVPPEWYRAVLGIEPVEMFIRIVWIETCDRRHDANAARGSRETTKEIVIPQSANKTIPPKDEAESVN